MSDLAPGTAWAAAFAHYQRCARMERDCVAASPVMHDRGAPLHARVAAAREYVSFAHQYRAQCSDAWTQVERCRG